MEIFIGLIKETWHTLNEASFYILIGIFFAGLIQIFISKDQISKHLGQSKFKSVLLAALSGIPLPLCSCGVIPMAISLRKSGASRGATLSFLISTPESGIDSIALSYALLDPLMAVFRPIAAFITAILAGISENILGSKEDKIINEGKDTCVSCNKNEKGGNHQHNLFEKFKYSMRFAFIDLLGDIAKWFMLGIVLAGIISYFVPVAFIANNLSRGWQAMFFMLLAGIPLYICASASTPIAAALILKGMSPGVALVFLLVGPATNAATIVMVGKFLGRKSAITYLVSISICAILMGLLLNQIYIVAGIDVNATLGKAGDVIPHSLKIISTFVLIILMANTFRSKKSAKGKN